MPQIFKFGGYIIFFWSNENKPTEPIHVHIAKHSSLLAKMIESGQPLAAGRIGL